jgi:hypothetical protein
MDESRRDSIKKTLLAAAALGASAAASHAATKGREPDENAKATKGPGSEFKDRPPSTTRSPAARAPAPQPTPSVTSPPVKPPSGTLSPVTGNRNQLPDLPSKKNN